MIKVTKNTTVISGTLTTILSEITAVLRKVYEEMKETIGEEKANEYLTEVGRLAVMSEDELKNRVEELIKERFLKWQSLSTY